MKIAVTGKGGSGKTTVASGLSFLFAKEGRRVIAVDCDPDMNLGFSLGFSGPEKITPISQMKDLIAERTGQGPDKPAGFFKLNPKVDDIPEKFCPQEGNIRLIVMGKVNKAGAGCLCPENTFVRRLISHLVLNQDDVVILDMVAGTEHLGRGTADSVDAFLIVSEPTSLGVNTALNIKSLAKDLGVSRIFFIGNKVTGPEDTGFLKERLKEGLIGSISFNRTLQDARGKFAFDNASAKEFGEIYSRLTQKIVSLA